MTTTTTASREPVLYIWGARWGLPSFDPTCLSTVMYMQRTLPGQYSVVECNNPDISPTGQLPFLVHEQQVLAGLRPIVKYISELASKNGQCDFPTLARQEKARQVAWIAHAEAHLGDLVYYSLFSHLDNWYQLTHPTLVSFFPVPHRYYMPGRIRESFRPRLEAAGLWKVHKEESKEKSLFKPKSKIEAKLEEKEEHKRSFQQAFGREKVLEKAKESLDPYVELLGGKNYVFSQGLSQLDVVVASHILLLTEPDYPDSTVKTLLKTTYSPLVSYSQRILAETLNQHAESIKVKKEDPSFWRALVPNISNSTQAPEKSTPEDAQSLRITLGFVGLTLGSLAAYLILNFNALEAHLAAEKQSKEEGTEH